MISPSNLSQNPNLLNTQTSLTSVSATSISSSNSNNNSITNTSNNTISASPTSGIVLPMAGVVAHISNYFNDQLVGHGHFFTKKTFHKPTYCHHCTEMLWGIIGQGFICEG